MHSIPKLAFQRNYSIIFPRNKVYVQPIMHVCALYTYIQTYVYVYAHTQTSYVMQHIENNTIP